MIQVGCSQHAPDAFSAPAPIGHDSMVVVLTDIHILESTLDLNVVSNLEDTLHGNKHYAVLRSHQISVEQFNKALAYYAGKPTELKDIYAQVVKRLQSKYNQIH